MALSTKALSRSTQLDDRIVWFDGDSSFNSAKIEELFGQYTVKYVTEMSDQIRQYNQNVSKQDEIKVKTESRPVSIDWNIPDEYKTLDVVGYLFDKHIEQTKHLSEQEVSERDYRLLTEIALYKKYQLFDVLRAIIWIINTLTANNVVWGVGRGSSVSSYALYIIGVHDVDAFAYDLDIADFLHD